MSRSRNNKCIRVNLLRLPDRYTGWMGEQCWRSHGKRFLKKLQHRAVRRFWQQRITEECSNLEQA